MACTGVSMKSRGKTYSQGFWQGTGKIVIVWDYFEGGNGDEGSVLSSFCHCKLKYQGPRYFTVYINFMMFPLKREKPNDNFLPLYFPQCHALEFESKGSFWYEQPTFPLNCFASVNFQNFCQTVALAHMNAYNKGPILHFAVQGQIIQYLINSNTIWLTVFD